MCGLSDPPGGWLQRNTPSQVRWETISLFITSCEDSHILPQTGCMSQLGKSRGARQPSAAVCTAALLGCMRPALSWERWERQISALLGCMRPALSWEHWAVAGCVRRHGGMAATKLVDAVILAALRAWVRPHNTPSVAFAPRPCWVACGPR